MRETAAFQIMTLYRDFLSYTTERLKTLGLRFGQMPFILFIGKHPGCTQADLTRALGLDWGYSQRSIAKLAEQGFKRKEYDEEKAGNCLSLTAKGENVFDASHQVFSDWDQSRTGILSEEEKETLIRLLCKITGVRKESC